jgi:hypothetical protein
VWLLLEYWGCRKKALDIDSAIFAEPSPPFAPPWNTRISECLSRIEAAWCITHVFDCRDVSHSGMWRTRVYRRVMYVELPRRTMFYVVSRPK